MSMKPFEGIKAIDMCWSGVGASVLNLLSQYGATVIRVESAKQPDPIRRVLTYTNYTKDTPHVLEHSAYFAFTHPAKKYGMTLDLKNPGAKGVLNKLVAWADIIGESFPTGVIERLGFGYEELKKIKPDIIMFRSCGYGHTGSMAKQPGFGMILSAVCMMYSLSGWPDRRPVPLSSYYSDQLSPLCGMLAVVTALDYRRRTGKGQCLDQSQIESGLNYLAPLILDYAANKRELALTGNKCDYAAPHGVYRCQGDDRWVTIAVFTDEEWHSFCQVLGNPAWTKDPRFMTTTSRIKNSDELDKLVEAWTINHKAEQVMTMMQAAGVGAGVVANAQDIVEDVQLEHYEYFREVDHPYTGKANYYHPTAVKLSEANAEVGRPPLLGEHNQYICQEVLGMSDADFTRLKQEGAFE
jgi:benzylsuccinate CoA-transferase BbsF subunit